MGSSTETTKRARTQSTESAAAAANAHHGKQQKRKRVDTPAQKKARNKRKAAKREEERRKAAEEKDKGYACVVWTANAITKADLARFHKECTSHQGSHQGTGVGAGGSRNSYKTSSMANILEIKQKTPLRVLHRRSQLTRTRHISNVETVLLGPHFLLLRLQTSAGTYVKEWVHGDLGRTSPSLSSILGTQADILQLDVVRLFDVYEGGGAWPSSDDIAKYNSESWNRLGRMRIPGISSNANSATAKSTGTEQAQSSATETESSATREALTVSGERMHTKIDKENIYHR